MEQIPYSAKGNENSVVTLKLSKYLKLCIITYINSKNSAFCFPISEKFPNSKTPPHTPNQEALG